MGFQWCLLPCLYLPARQNCQSLDLGLAAHGWFRQKARTDGWTIGMPEDEAEIVGGELDTANPGRLSIRHARDG